MSVGLFEPNPIAIAPPSWYDVSIGGFTKFCKSARFVSRTELVADGLEVVQSRYERGDVLWEVVNLEGWLSKVPGNVRVARENANCIILSETFLVLACANRDKPVSTDQSDSRVSGSQVVEGFSMENRILRMSISICLFYINQNNSFSIRQMKLLNVSTRSILLYISFLFACRIGILYDVYSILKWNSDILYTFWLWLRVIEEISQIL